MPVIVLFAEIYAKYSHYNEGKAMIFRRYIASFLMNLPWCYIVRVHENNPQFGEKYGAYTH